MSSCESTRLTCPKWIFIAFWMNLDITSSSNPEEPPKRISIQEDTISSLDFAKELGLTIYDNGYLNTGMYGAK